MQPSKVTKELVETPQKSVSFDVEIASLRAVAGALGPLDKAARERVIRWAIQYFGANDFTRGF